METVIDVERLHKRYGPVTAVADVSLSVRRGEIFGILGPNGAGKTTTVECLQGLRPRDGGKLAVLGLDPDRDVGRLRRRIGAQLQSAALPDRLRAGEAITLFGRRFTGDQSVDVAHTLETWGLTALRRRAYGALSGGQRQRLFLALAMLGSPEIVFLDELTTGLDPVARRTTWDLVRRVRDRGATVVLVTHLMEEAEALCDRVAVVDGGRVVALDTPAALAARHGGAVRTTFTAGPSDVTFLRLLPGVTAVTVDGGRVTVEGTGPAAVRVAAALAEHGLFPDDFRTHHPRLEGVFLALTGRRLDEGAQ
ncbi:ABC transporter ATP-binding protein [Catellatospora chokoriensis]|uniref:Multidrug ABC transporter ATP-binding protein n=1 Tax=Catellatospora chokoriensis TaxID=310353 RepID=A0A8J3NPT9_9ACTN|nr:ABC transporter ATP-binding protein [Catellatospora chokoriensis]GIF87821.1 multidrug ABC transporter ATP-binding protein [Catellatospora chokoriensis]